MRLAPHHTAYLERTARRLARRSGHDVAPLQVLEALLDMAIADEGMYDPADPLRPLDPLRRQFLQGEGTTRTTSFDGERLVAALRGD